MPKSSQYLKIKIIYFLTFYCWIFLTNASVAQDSISKIKNSDLNKRFSYGVELGYSMAGIQHVDAAPLMNNSLRERFPFDGFSIGGTINYRFKDVPINFESGLLFQLKYREMHFLDLPLNLKFYLMDKKSLSLFFKIGIFNTLALFDAPYKNFHYYDIGNNFGIGLRYYIKNNAKGELWVGRSGGFFLFEKIAHSSGGTPFNNAYRISTLDIGLSFLIYK
jgi:hypothetical protein